MMSGIDSTCVRSATEKPGNAEWLGALLARGAHRWMRESTHEHDLVLLFVVVNQLINNRLDGEDAEASRAQAQLGRARLVCANRIHQG